LVQKQIEVKRTRGQIVSLMSKLDNSGSEFTFNSDTDMVQSEAADLLETRLNNLVEVEFEVAVAPWNCTPLVEFLDGAAAPACLSSSAFVMMKNKVKLNFPYPVRDHFTRMLTTPITLSYRFQRWMLRITS
jgi:hypothetical protein